MITSLLTSTYTVKPMQSHLSIVDFFFNTAQSSLIPRPSKIGRIFLPQFQQAQGPGYFNSISTKYFLWVELHGYVRPVCEVEKTYVLYTYVYVQVQSWVPDPNNPSTSYVGNFHRLFMMSTVQFLQITTIDYRCLLQLDHQMLGQRPSAASGVEVVSQASSLPHWAGSRDQGGGSMQKVGGLKYLAPNINVYVLMIFTAFSLKSVGGALAPPAQSRYQTSCAVREESGTETTSCPPIPPPMCVQHLSVV